MDYTAMCFAVLNGAESLPTDNITTSCPTPRRSAGWRRLAGLMSLTGGLGFIGGMERTPPDKLAPM
jgi:hypothetical protein